MGSSSSTINRRSIRSRSCHYFCFHRQLDSEPAPRSRRAADDHLSTVGFHNVFDYAQADADALGFTPQFRAEAIKAFEDFLMFGFRNSWPLVFDVDLNDGSFFAPIRFSGPGR